MLATSIPTKFQLAFGASAGGSFIRAVPVASQIGINPGAASETDGFPPVCFIVPSAGGIPPDGRDVNGILNQATAWDLWQSVGGPVYYDAAQSTAIGGYPHGALLNAVGINAGYWFSLVDNNTSDPDTGGANWFFIQMGNNTTFVPIVPATTWFVDGTLGSDTAGQGLTSGAGAFKTIIFAVTTISKYFSASLVTVNVAAGTYAGFIVLNSLISSWSFVGSGASTCGVVQSGAGVTAGNGTLISAATVTLSGFKFIASGNGIFAQSSAIVNAPNCFFGSCTSGACAFAASGSQIGLSGAVTITGTSVQLAAATTGGIVNLASGNLFSTLPITLTFSSVTFTGSTVAVSQGGSIRILSSATTFSGTPTGSRFSLGFGSIDTQGQGLTYIPGTTAGTFVPLPTTSGGTSTTAAGTYT